MINLKKVKNKNGRVPESKGHNYGFFSARFMQFALKFWQLLVPAGAHCIN